MNWMMRAITPDEERDIAAFMDRLAHAVPAERPHLPEAGLLRLKGQLLARWDRERAVHAPLDVVDRLQLVGALIAAALMVAWSVPSLARLIGLVAA
jgi:hypothetical protein